MEAAAAEHGIAADRFAPEIGGILKASCGALAAAECQSVRCLSPGGCRAIVGGAAVVRPGGLFLLLARPIRARGAILSALAHATPACWWIMPHRNYRDSCVVAIRSPGPLAHVGAPCHRPNALLIATRFWSDSHAIADISVAHAAIRNRIGIPGVAPHAYARRPCPDPTPAACHHVHHRASGSAVVRIAEAHATGSDPCHMPTTVPHASLCTTVTVPARGWLFPRRT